MKVWAKRLLHAVLILGTAASAALWVAVTTVKCEGFGCLGIGAMAGMAFIAHLTCLLAGGMLIWFYRMELRVPRWLIVLEALHSLPVLWFGGRMALS